MWALAAQLLREHSPFLSEEARASLLALARAAAHQLGPGARFTEGLVQGLRLRAMCPPPAALQVRKVHAAGTGSAQGRGKVHNPFIYSPINDRQAPKAGAGGAATLWVAGELAQVEVELTNPTCEPLHVEALVLSTEGADFETRPVELLLPPHDPTSAPSVVVLSGRPLIPGTIKLRGCHVTCMGASWEQTWQHPPLEPGAWPGSAGACMASGDGGTAGAVVPVVGCMPLLVQVEAPPVRRAARVMLEGQRASVPVCLSNTGATPVARAFVTLTPVKPKKKKGGTGGELGGVSAVGDLASVVLRGQGLAGALPLPVGGRCTLTVDVWMTAPPGLMRYELSVGYMGRTPLPPGKLASAASAGERQLDEGGAAQAKPRRRSATVPGDAEPMGGEGASELPEYERVLTVPLEVQCVPGLEVTRAALVGPAAAQAASTRGLRGTEDEEKREDCFLQLEVLNRSDFTMRVWVEVLGCRERIVHLPVVLSSGGARAGDDVAEPHAEGPPRLFPGFQRLASIRFPDRRRWLVVACAGEECYSRCCTASAARLLRAAGYTAVVEARWGSELEAMVAAELGPQGMDCAEAARGASERGGERVMADLAGGTWAGQSVGGAGDGARQRTQMQGDQGDQGDQGEPARTPSGESGRAAEMGNTATSSTENKRPAEGRDACGETLKSDLAGESDGSGRVGGEVSAAQAAELVACRGYTLLHVGKPAVGAGALLSGGAFREVAACEVQSAGARGMVVGVPRGVCVAAVLALALREEEHRAKSAPRSKEELELRDAAAGALQQHVRLRWSAGGGDEGEGEVDLRRALQGWLMPEVRHVLLGPSVTLDVGQTASDSNRDEEGSTVVRVGELRPLIVRVTNRTPTDLSLTLVVHCMDAAGECALSSSTPGGGRKAAKVFAAGSVARVGLRLASGGYCEHPFALCILVPGHYVVAPHAEVADLDQGAASDKQGIASPQQLPQVQSNSYVMEAVM
ncbi:hypothetical protein CYMTET_24599 [Cymbomonas tetramitiformis]|nr:hypothetical protein CYMTET_24599 [Cymbomonas tetramitiformis]